MCGRGTACLTLVCVCLWACACRTRSCCTKAKAVSRITVRVEKRQLISVLRKGMPLQGLSGNLFGKTISLCLLIFPMWICVCECAMMFFSHFFFFLKHVCSFHYFCSSSSRHAREQQSLWDFLSHSFSITAGSPVRLPANASGTSLNCDKIF